MATYITGFTSLAFLRFTRRPSPVVTMKTDATSPAAASDVVHEDGSRASAGGGQQSEPAHSEENTNSARPAASRYTPSPVKNSIATVPAVWPEGRMPATRPRPRAPSRSRPARGRRSPTAHPPQRPRGRRRPGQPEPCGANVRRRGPAPWSRSSPRHCSGTTGHRRASGVRACRTASPMTAVGQGVRCLRDEASLRHRRPQ